MEPTKRSGLSTLLSYLPLATMAVTVIVAATAAQFQINRNSEDIASNKEGLELRVPTFLFETRISRSEATLLKVADDVEENEDEINKLIRGSDGINAKLELEIERLRAEIERASAAQAEQLRAILKLLQEQTRE